jgi:outer membrane protein TolC
MLLAQVRVGELEAQRAQAAGDALVARLGLAVQMGLPGDTSASLPAALPGTATIRALVDAGWPHADGAEARRDVQAAQLGARAARADVQRTNGSWLPTVGAMVRHDWATVDQPFGGSPFWTVGVMASWQLLRGGADLADRERATARARAAAERASGAAAQASLEATQARIRRDVALERLAIADRSLVQAQEALRLVQRRYDGGLAAITELLDAAAARTAADLASVAARHDALVALAAERTALGLDLTPLLALDR